MFEIKGLRYIAAYISRPEEKTLIQAIDAQAWRTDLSRRTQHYGYVYDYRARNVDPSMYLGSLPPWLQPLATRLHDDGLMPVVPDQAIINEYQPGQGIADHIDCTPCFGNVVVSLSLGSAVVMDLKRAQQKVAILLEPRSVLVLRGEARYRWRHGIAKRKRDVINGSVIERERRVSVTFRKVIIAENVR